ncbi:hypothetical protein EMIT0P44_130095 [Pseudomonas sp. IT-P44]
MSRSCSQAYGSEPSALWAIGALVMLADWGMKGSRAMYGIEGFAGYRQMTQIPVGASLLAKAVCQSPSMLLTGRLRRQAGLAPTVFVHSRPALGQA